MLKRNWRARMALLLAVALLAVMFGGTALADTKTKTMKVGSWVAVQSRDDATQKIYVLKLTKNSILNISMKNNNGKDEVRIEIFRDAACKTVCMRQNIKDKMLSFQGALLKGTYYCRFTVDSAKSKAKVRVKTSKYTNKSNYTMDRAITLAPKTKVTVVQTPMDDYCRYYKIKLKKNTLSCRVFSKDRRYPDRPGYHLYSIKLFSSYGGYLEAEYDDYTSVKKYTNLSPGTYYIRVGDYGFSSGDDAGTIISFWWF